MKAPRSHAVAMRLAIAMLLVSAAPAAASVNIPEGGAVSPGSVFVINFQVQEGCDGQPTDTLEVTIPDVVSDPRPEGVPGWTTTFMTETDDDGEEVTLVRWTGGSLEADAIYHFGMRLGFPDEPGATIEFPVVQRCGLTEVRSNPTVTLQPRFGPRDILDLADQTASLQDQLEELSGQLEALQSQLDEMGERIDALEEGQEALDDEVDGTG